MKNLLLKSKDYFRKASIWCKNNKEVMIIGCGWMILDFAFGRKKSTKKIQNNDGYTEIVVTNPNDKDEYAIINRSMEDCEIEEIHNRLGNNEKLIDILKDMKVIK